MNISIYINSKFLKNLDKLAVILFYKLKKYYPQLYIPKKEHFSVYEFHDTIIINNGDIIIHNLILQTWKLGGNKTTYHIRRMNITRNPICERR